MNYQNTLVALQTHVLDIVSTESNQLIYKSMR